MNYTMAEFMGRLATSTGDEVLYLIHLYQVGAVTVGGKDHDDWEDEYEEELFDD